MTCLTCLDISRVWAYIESCKCVRDIVKMLPSQYVTPIQICEIENILPVEYFALNDDGSRHILIEYSSCSVSVISCALALDVFVTSVLQV